MKKMRRMIPALCMLLVSAIMLSTASYAWFTMNEQVTATGMQVQAKATGNLIINTDLMSAANQDLEVTVANPGKISLTQITYDYQADRTATVKGENDEDIEVPNRYIFKELADGVKVDPTWGGLLDEDGDGLVEVNAAATENSKYFAEYTVYLATSGEDMEGYNVYAKINGLSGSDQYIAPAYTIAFWVIEDNTVDPDYNEPTYVMNYKDGQVKTLLTDTADERITIPSTFEKGADNKVGAKIVMRIFVDGGLVKNENNTVMVDDIKEGFTASNEENADNTWGTVKETIEELIGDDYSTAKSIVYYVNGVAVAEDDLNTWEDDKTFEAGTVISYLYDNAKKSQAAPEYYVNNEHVPAGSTTFEVEFSVAEPTT